MSGAYDYRRYAILYVDDEEQSLKYFRRAYEKDFQILTAANVAEALGILDEQGDRVGVVITDQRMPGQTGVDLLGRVRRARPGIVRVLTTAYADLESAIDGVNSGAIYRYITKPWNFKDLRGTLMRAMEFFLVQQERDLLLREKLSVLQRLIITDRVRSLAVLAGGLAHHIRNSTTALTAFLDLAAPRSPAAAASGPFPEGLTTDLWDLARQENGHLQRIVQQVADMTIEPSPSFGDRVALEELVRRGAAAANRRHPGAGDELRMSIEPGLPPLRVDALMAERLFGLLLERLFRLGGAARGVTVRAGAPDSVWGTPGVRVFLAGAGPAWSEDLVSSFYTLFAPAPDDPRALGLDLLSAFCIVHHHGGDLTVHRDHPEGPGFEVHLPFDPEAVSRPPLEENCLEKLFHHFEAWDSVRGEG